MAVDCYWFGGTASEMAVIRNQLGFFYGEGINAYGNGYTLDGIQVSPWHSQSVVAMNATGALVSDYAHADDFVLSLWNAPQPTGQWRYYDGCLYMLGLLHCSGNYKMYGYFPNWSAGELARAILCPDHAFASPGHRIAPRRRSRILPRSGR